MKLKRKLLAAMLSIMLIVSVVVQPLSIMSATSDETLPGVEGQNGGEQPPETLVITSTSLDQGDEIQTIIQGSETAVNLPQVSVTYSDNTTDKIDVTWTANTAFDVNAIGEYRYSASFIEMRYTLAEGVSMPEMTVVVEAATQNPEVQVITAVGAIDESIKLQTITAGSETTPNLPRLAVTFKDGTTETIDAGWISDIDFDVNLIEIYSYTANIDTAKYSLAADVALPTITVEVKAEENVVAGHQPMMTGGTTGGTGGTGGTTGGTGGTTSSTATTITSETFKNYVAGKPATLWDYTTATVFSYDIAFTVESDETVDRVFTIDINPHNIEDFPYRISGAPTITGFDGQTSAIFDDGNTELTYTVPISLLKEGITEGQSTTTAGFNIGISLNPGVSETVYAYSDGTFAAAIGHTLLNDLDAKFGVRLDDNKTAGLDIDQRHVPNLYDADTSGNLVPWTSENIIGNTSITGVTYTGDKMTVNHNHIATENDVDNETYSLWIGSNGVLYFGDGKDFINSSNENGKITTTINSDTRQLPIDGISYTTYNKLNTLVKTGDNIINGTASPSTDSFGYEHETLGAPFSETFDTNEHHYFEGSLPTDDPRSISVNISSIESLIPSDMNLNKLKDLGVKYITVPADLQSTISYRQLTVDTNGTPTDASDDIYGVTTVDRTTTIPSIVVNIDNYTLVDKLVTEPGRDGFIVREDTKELAFELENTFPVISSSPGAPFTEPYDGHTLTIEIPETFEVGQLKISGSGYNEEEDFTHFQYLKDGTLSEKIAANWVGNILQLPDGMENLYGIDKIILYISDTGLTGPQFEGVSSGVTRSYAADITFTDCKLSQPSGEPNVNNRYETTMPIYLSAPDKNGVYTKLENPDGVTNVDDLNLVWQYELPGETDIDNLTLTLEANDRGDYDLDDQGREETVFTAYITQALANGTPSFSEDSRVFKDVVINITTGQDNHMQLIRQLRINGSITSDGTTWEFIPSKTITEPSVTNNVVLYYTTNERTEEVRVPLDIEDYTDFDFRRSSEYITSLRIEIDEMILPASTFQRKNITFIEFRYSDSPTVANGDLPIIGDDLTDTLYIEMLSGDFSFQKKDSADKKFTYDVPTARLVSVEGNSGNYTPSHGQEHMALKEDVVINYHIQDTETTSVTSEADKVKEINSLFPEGSAIYLKLNPTYFEYIGPETDLITRVSGTDKSKWLRYDISGEDGIGSVSIPRDTIIVKEELPKSGVPLFESAYLDTSALLEVDFYENDFLEYTSTEGGVSDTIGITADSDEYYGIQASSNGLVAIFDSDGKEPNSLTISPVSSYIQTVSANSQISNEGQLEFGTKQEDKNVIRYYAHESDDLELRLLLGTDITNAQDDVIVNILLPIDSETMRIGLRGDIYDSFSTEIKALIGEKGNITYYSDENATVAVVPNSDFRNVMSAKIKIPHLEASTLTELPIKLIAFEDDVYSKDDNAQVDVIASSTLTNNAKLIVSYIFDWYELSGIAYSEKTNDTQNGIFDGDDEYLDELSIASFEGLNEAPEGVEILSYDSLTGKYTILIQPKDTVYNLIHSPINDAYEVSTIIPTTSLSLNNNYEGTKGVRFIADIDSGLSTVSGSANPKQVEIDNGNVDLALIETVFTVTFKTDKDATTNVDQYTDVTKNSTIPNTDETFDIPDDKVLIGWTVDETPTIDSELWNFNDDNGDSTEDTKVLGDVILYPVIIDKDDSVTVTFKTGGIDTVKPENNGDFTISPDENDASKVIVKGGNIEIEPTTTPNTTDNKEFEFWYIDENGNGSYDDGETKYSKDVTYDENTVYLAEYKDTSSGTTTPPTQPPVEPETTTPDEPEPETPDEPEVPEPETPDEPEVPEPETPDEPEVPEPETPDEPEGPGGVEEGGTVTVDPDDVTVDEDGNITVSPDIFEDLPDGEYIIEVEVDGIKYTATAIVANGVPLSIGEFTPGGAWSLFDLLSTIFVTMTVFYVAFIKRRDRKEEDEEEVNEYLERYEEIEDRKFEKLRKGKTINLAIEAVMVIILLFVTQDFTLPMIIFDIYSIAFALAVILSIVIVKLADKNKNDEEEEDISIEEELERDMKKLRQGRIIASIIDIILIIALVIITRDLSNLFVIDAFTIIFILCAVLLITIFTISTNVDIDDKDQTSQN